MMTNATASWVRLHSTVPVTVLGPQPRHHHRQNSHQCLISHSTPDGSMAEEALLDKISNLSDLELAALLCLTNEEHCIIDTDPDSIEHLVHELRLIASNVFGLSHAVIDCSEQTTLEDFDNALQTEPPVSPREDSPARYRHDSHLQPSPGFRSLSRSSPRSETFADSRKIASVIIAKDLDEAPKQVQIQALELIRTKRIFTHTSVQSAPKRFLFIAVIAGGEGPRLTEHLNNHMFISHFHSHEDGYPNMDEQENDAESISSVIRKSDGLIEPSPNPVFTATDILSLQRCVDDVSMSIEVTGYIMNIIAFLRLHHAVSGGISPLATSHCTKLAKSLAPLHGLRYVTPSLVTLAVKKIYPHRICITLPERERSVQWGSNIDAVASVLEGMGPDAVIDDVIGSVEVPL
ncbi:hypothetical protein V493_01609 [Pseudogymnoascus sp. VKM F-4281 (FW-2241)]|nr:hypothetical protein V493_01609 [Pseudogymnoascus sp. VKM F-4281 (FW-2241)]